MNSGSDLNHFLLNSIDRLEMTMAKQNALLEQIIHIFNTPVQTTTGPVEPPTFKGEFGDVSE